MPEVIANESFVAVRLTSSFASSKPAEEEHTVFAAQQEPTSHAGLQSLKFRGNVEKGVGGFPICGHKGLCKDGMSTQRSTIEPGTASERHFLGGKIDRARI